MSTYEATVEHEFAASHALRLGGLDAEPLHRHQWRVKACFRSDKLNEHGVVIDFLVVKASLAVLCKELDSTDLNSLPAFVQLQPSAERVAEYLAGRLMRQLGPEGRLLYRLSLTEAPGCTAAYFPRSARRL